jgi:hypothetical protein
MLCLAALALKAQTITWTGAGDGTSWSDANNWDLLVKPTKEHDVIIPDGSSVTIRDGDIIRIKSLIVQGNTVLNINDSISFEDPSLFEENVVVNWHFGALFGGVISDGSYNCLGILTNKGIINVDRPVPSFATPSFLCGSFHNEGTIKINSGALIITFAALLVNESNGVIELNEGYGIGSGIDGIGTLDNYGIIKKEISDNSSIIGVILNNMGIIEVLDGEIDFWSSYSLSLNNTVKGIIRGTGVINLSQLNSFSNTGSFEPGASPGTLTVIGDFTSALGSNLKIELNGVKQGSEYDLLSIQGNASFFSYVDSTLGFEPEIYDEFIIVTSTGSITDCNFAEMTTAEFKDNLYKFSVSCRNNNEIVLTVVDITLGIDKEEFASKNILVFPNPVANSFTLRNNSTQDLKSATLIDLNGRIVENIDLKGMNKDKFISLQNYATGFYLIKINSENSSIVKKIVKL